MLQDQGAYNKTIPSGTAIPNWAYMKPSNYNDYFSPVAAQLVGGESRYCDSKGLTDCGIVNMKIYLRVDSRFGAQRPRQPAPLPLLYQDPRIQTTKAQS